MRWLPVVLIAACVHNERQRHIYVPKTPEAARCWRECKAIAMTCENAPRPVNGMIGDIARINREEECEDQRKDCLLTCPGAREEWRTPGYRPREHPEEPNDDGS